MLAGLNQRMAPQYAKLNKALIELVNGSFLYVGETEFECWIMVTLILMCLF